MLSPCPLMPPEVSCGDPGTVAEAYRSGPHFDYLSKVTYTCNRGYDIKSGDAVRTCQWNKVWSGYEATCGSKYQVYVGMYVGR